MGSFILAWFLKRWLYVLVVAAIIGGFGWVAGKYYFKGRHAEINLNLKELQKIQDRREGIDEKISDLDDARLRGELRRWVRDEGATSNPKVNSDDKDTKGTGPKSP